MSIYYQAEVHITKQEDGLWRLYVPDLKGGWVDTKTMEDGFTELQEAIALMIDYYKEHGWQLPNSIKVCEGEPTKTVLPIILDEYKFSTVRTRRGRTKSP